MANAFFSSAANQLIRAAVLLSELPETEALMIANQIPAESLDFIKAFANKEPIDITTNDLLKAWPEVQSLRQHIRKNNSVAVLKKPSG